ncbi:hypothetical protein I310_04033 [Cryptococcus deuterogattii CA1014]|nr:hypothetical protein I310_04033 [Cryptococcus deuterogattii CA1014]
MAENILGLLLVTSSSRGRHVFRYPPDPASPNVRLAQPIYPSATFTATEADVEYKHPRAGGAGMRRRPYDDLSSNASIRRSLFGPSTRGSSKTGRDRKGKKKADDIRARYMNTLEEANGSDYEDEDSEQDDSSSDEGSDFEVMWKPATTSGANDASGTGSTKVAHRRASGDDDQRASGVRNLEPSVLDASRRGSTSTTTATITGADRNNDHADKDAKRLAIESQYNYALGWPLEVLADMLTPPRSACNRRFELCVGNVVFLGHPVCASPDGKWEVPPDEDELEERAPSRGRRMRDQGGTMTNLDTVDEGIEAYTSAITRHAKTESEAKRSSDSSHKDDDVPNLTMFHLVLIIDKPDPKPGTESHDEHHSQAMDIYDEIYREIAFKWTAAAFNLQCESNLVAREAWMIVKYKDKCLNEGIGITECCRWTATHSHIDRTLNYLYLRLHQLRTQPANGLHSYLPTTITSRLAHITIQTVLSPKPVNTDEAWAHWGEMEEMLSDKDSEESLSDWEDDWGGGAVMGMKRPELIVKPWQTLLLIDEDRNQSQEALFFGIVGLPAVIDDDDALDSKANGRKSPVKSRTRRGSKITVEDNVTEDSETVLRRTLIEACDVTKPLYEIAHLLRYDLDGVVIPLARDLVQSKRAILIDVVNPRLRTVVMPTTIDEHNSSFDQYTARFARDFSNLPPFPRFISAISLSPVPFRKVIPNPDPDHATREKYMSALLWLLKQDLVVQVHTRARVFAKSEIKVEAWKRLWYRRRQRWIEITKERTEREKALAQSPSDHSDILTPRASESHTNPLDATTFSSLGTTPIANTFTVPLPNGNSKLEHSYMDYDPALEMDSDEEFDGLNGPQKFSLDAAHPAKHEIPNFESSFIFKPARAQKDEARWLRVIREKADEVWASKFDL